MTDYSDGARASTSNVQVATRGGGLPGAWARGSSALAAWAWKWLVNRDDAWGGYYSDREGNTRQTTHKAGDPIGRDGKKARGTLSLANLAAHFRATRTDSVLGLHSTSRDGEGRCWSRWLAIDIDRHGDDGDPEANLRFALHLFGIARDLGFRPLLIDSNGRGGYHLILVFDGPTPTREVFTFARWLIREWEAHGLDGQPETFPKQPGIAEGK